MSNRLLLPLLALLPLVASTASAQSDLADASRAILFFGGGFGGQVQYHSETDVPVVGTVETDADFDLDATPVLGLRYDAPILEYLAVGAQFGTSFWRDENQDGRNTLIDFDVVPRGRFPFTVGGLLLEPYLAVPIGFTLAIWNDDNYASGSDQDKTNPGFNVGVLGGFSLLTRSRFGAMLELGWMHHNAYDSYGDTKLRGAIDQFTLHVGAMYAL